MAERPNLLYMHSDQHSPFVASCYGDNVVDTPNLDALAKRGVTLDGCYCPSPICVPSRMSALTGRYPYENRVWTNSHILDSSIPTLAHAMGAGGYRPALIGRMHAVGPDQLHGYAERLVGDHGPNQAGGRGVDHGELSGTAGPARVSLTKSGSGQSAYQVHDEDVAASAVDWLNRYGVRRRSGVETEPFSLSVGFMLPHQPFVARRQDYERYQGRVPPPQNPMPFSDDLHPHIRTWRSTTGIKEVMEEEVIRARVAYWALVYRMDVLIGQIFEALRLNDLEDNTFIIYTSDHGEQVGERGLWWKQTFYDESARIPAIVSWPGHLPNGERCHRVTSTFDLNATMLDALDCPALPYSRGRSLLPLLRGESTDWGDIAFSEFCQDSAGAGGPFPENGIQQRMVRFGDWKLNYYHGQPCQLFNLCDDPRELDDRADDPACREIRGELLDRVLDGWDPEAVMAQMAHLREDNKILAAWGRHVRPADTIRWDLRPDMDYLD
ncbi:MAG: sulfatase-like hydrolase/transferase [Candidatus Latescibacterota bacterium]|nr:sulfatase-like hydrolase/transferase [Candidatus Latescibacterota bacterium]